MIKNIIIFILIMAFIGIVVLLDIPKFQDILNTKKQIDKETDIILERQEVLNKIESLKEIYEENQESLKKADYILPSTKDIPNLIVQLEAMALEGGLILENIKFSEIGEQVSNQIRIPEQITPAKKYNTLEIEMNLVGDYLTFKNFLNILEENIRLMDVQAVELSVQTGEEVQFFEISISLQTYYQ